MSPAEFAVYVRFLTDTDATSFPDAKLLAVMNARKDEIAKEIVKANEDIFGIYSYANLEAGVREYPFPNDVLSQIKYVEAKVANGGTEWKKLSEVDLNQYGGTTDEASIRSSFSGRYCYDLFRRSLLILTGEEIVDVTDGIKLWRIKRPPNITDLSSTTDMSIDPSNTTHGIPSEVHEVWARAVSITYKGSRDKPIPLTQNELNYGADLKLAIDALRGGNLDREVVSSVPTDGGEDY